MLKQITVEGWTSSTSPMLNAPINIAAQLHCSSRMFPRSADRIPCSECGPCFFQPIQVALIFWSCEYRSFRERELLVVKKMKSVRTCRRVMLSTNPSRLIIVHCPSLIKFYVLFYNKIKFDNKLCETQPK